MEGGLGGGGDVELLSRTLQFEHKLFYFDLKENPRGRYLKISEKTSSTRSTIIVPVDGIVWFLDLFNYYITSEDRDLISKELKLDTKVFNFDVGENRRGRFLKAIDERNPLVRMHPASLRRRDFFISEASNSRNRSTIYIPAGSSGEEGWTAFRDVLLEINDETSRLFVAQNQQHLEPPNRIPGLSDDVGAGFISGHGAQPGSRSELNADRLVELHPQEDVAGVGTSKVIRVDQKRFFFDLGNNTRGHFLKISEVAGSDRSSIILPLSALRQFHEMIEHFVEITKDRLEDITGTNAQ